MKRKWCGPRTLGSVNIFSSYTYQGIWIRFEDLRLTYTYVGNLLDPSPSLMPLQPAVQLQATGQAYAVPFICPPFLDSKCG